MTRHSPSEATLGETPVSGLHANFTLLSAFNDAVGKEVLLELVDGSVFTGIFGGASSEMEVGLYCAYEKTAENEKNLLPLKKDIVQKRQFAFSDIVCVTVPTNDEKLIRGFATDRDYHNKRRAIGDDDELEAWEGDGEDVDLESDEAVKAGRSAAARNGGWGVNEMFAANQSLGVKTTFEDNLSQYTTAEVEGTDEDRKRADEIAKQIEKNGTSRIYCALENDDEERDLDKYTDEADLLGYETKNKKLAGRGVNNNGRGGSQVTPKNNRADGLKGDNTRRLSNSGGGGGIGGAGVQPPLRGQPISSPKGGVTTGGGQGGYVKRDSYDGGSTGGGQGQHYDNWNKGGMKTYENTKIRDQKMMLENRNGPSNSPRNAGVLPSGPSTPHNQKGGTSGRVEGLKAWQNDFNYKESRPLQKGQGEKMDSPEGTPLLESGPPTKNAWQSGPPSGLTSSSSKSDESKSGLTLPSPSNVNAPTPAELKMNEEKEKSAEETGASTSNEGDKNEKSRETSNANETREDADSSKSSNKPFSFNPDAPVFTPKFGGGGVGGMGGAMVAPTIPPTNMMVPNVPLPPTLVTTQGMPMQGQMGGMAGMPPVVYPYPTQATYQMQPAGMQYSAVVNGGGIMAGAAQNGQGQTGGTVNTPRGNGGQGIGGTGMRQGGGRQGGQGGGGGGQSANVAVPNPAMYVQPVNYPVPMGQNYMQPQPNYYYPAQSPMMQGSYPTMMSMQQQGMMGQPQRAYVPQPNQMMMQYNMQQQYGGGLPPGVNPQQGGGVGLMGSGPQGGTGGGGGGNGATPSGSNTSGGPSVNGNGGGGQGGAPNTHPPSQPPTPGAGPPSQTGVGGAPPQNAMMPPQGGPPGMVAPVHSPGMYGMYGGGPQVVYYNQGGPQMGGGGGEMGGMHGGGEGPEGTMHHMYQYNPGQYYQNAPPHIMRAAYSNMNQGMPQQPQHAPAQPSQSQN